MTGIGNIVGPIMSSFIYGKLGFTWAFGVCGMTIVVTSFFFFCFFPKVSTIKNETEDFLSAEIVDNDEEEF